jgi:phosphate transport system substrate-binding protein
MKMVSRYALVTAVLLMACSAWSVRSASAETLSIQGAGDFVEDVLVPYQAGIQQMTGHKLNIVTTSSLGGLLALFNGKADLAMISGPLDQMVPLLRQTRPDLPFHRLHEFRIAAARVAYPVNPEVRVRSMSIAKLKMILTGEISNWRELGGRDVSLTVVSTRDGGTRLATEAVLLDGQPIKPHHEILVNGSRDVIKAVAETRGALGITQARLVSRYGLPEIQTRVLIERPQSFVSLGEPTEAMRAVIAAARGLVYEEEP